MTEIKTVKINLKCFLEEMLIALESNNKDEVKELNEKFLTFFTKQNKEIREGIIKYFNASKMVVNSYTLRSYIQKIRV